MLQIPYLNRRCHASIFNSWLSAALLSLALGPWSFAASPRPNILFIVGDDMG